MPAPAHPRLRQGPLHPEEEQSVPVNGRVLRQMPSEEAIKVAEAIGRFQGMFVNLKV